MNDISVLIVSSDFTGHGHKSISEALMEEFKKYEHNGIKVHLLDGFSLGGKFSILVGKLYGKITRAPKIFWKSLWTLSEKRPKLICKITKTFIKKKLLNIIKETNPNVILSVHAIFNSSIIDLLQKNNINIPVLVVIADLVNINPLWADSRNAYLFCPTQEAKQKCINFGIDESQILSSGFPIRYRFHKHLKLNKSHSLEKKIDLVDDVNPLRFLIMSGGEGSGNIEHQAKIILDNFNSTVSIICGRNKKLEKKLEKKLLQKYNNRIKIYGFVNNVHKLMLESQLCITRGSPNAMLECSMCELPMVITGALDGQEEKNPAFAEKYNIGVRCEKLSNLKNTISSLLENHAKKLIEIKKCQKNFNSPGATAKIVEFVINFAIENQNKN